MKHVEGKVQLAWNQSVVDKFLFKKSIFNFVHQHFSYFVFRRNLAAAGENSSEDSVLVTEHLYDLFHKCQGLTRRFYRPLP